MTYYNIVTETDDFIRGLIIHKHGDNSIVVGQITNQKYTPNNGVLIGVDWFVQPEDFMEDVDADTRDHDRPTLIIGASKSNPTTYDGLKYNGTTIISDYIDYSIQDVINNSVDKQHIVIFADSTDFAKYEEAIAAAESLSKLYEHQPIYRHIILYKDGKPKLSTLSDVLFMLDENERETYITALRYSNGYVYTLTTMADKIIDAARVTEGYDFMTQEQQVEAFINYSKLTVSDKQEHVTDDDLDALRESEAYTRTVSELTDKGFGLSNTQQTNVLQSVGYLTKNNKGVRGNNNILYNLSDMGSGTKSTF